MEETIKETNSLYFTVNGIAAIAFSKDCKFAAISVKEGCSVEIYEITNIKDVNDWKYVCRLKDHSQIVSVVEWCHQTNKILTASHDRSAYVWSDSGNNKWTKKLCVMVGQTRALLAGAWSPDGKYWAMSSGNHSLYFGYYEEEYEWWNSVLESYKASIVAMSFHPKPQGDPLLAIGLNDNTARVVRLSVTSPSKEVGRINLGSWVEGICWSPSGSYLVAASHGSDLSLIESSGEKYKQTGSGVWSRLPFTGILFKNEEEFVATGYDKAPILFKKSGSELVKVGVFEAPSAGQVVTFKASKIDSLARSVTSTGQNKDAKKFLPPFKVHHLNEISGLRAFKGDGSNCSTFCTIDVKGSIFFWDANQVSKQTIKC